MSEKFGTRDGYSADLSRACDTVLVLLLQAFGTFKGSVRLVGGLTPRYLAPEAPPDIPAHVGTTDVDVVLNVSVLAAKGAYARLRAQLKKLGFTPHVTDKGSPSSWQWVYLLDGREICVEFIQGTENPDESGTLQSLDGEGISAIRFLHAGLVHEWYLEREVTVDLPSGDGRATETVRYADPVAFMVLKTLAFDHRRERKDVADLIHVMRHWGRVEDLAALFAQRALEGHHRDALEETLALLVRHFVDQEGQEGWQKEGPTKFANFHKIGAPGDDVNVQERRQVSALVEHFVQLARDRLTTS